MAEGQKGKAAESLSRTSLTQKSENESTTTKFQHTDWPPKIAKGTSHATTSHSSTQSTSKQYQFTHSLAPKPQTFKQPEQRDRSRSRNTSTRKKNYSRNHSQESLTFTLPTQNTYDALTDRDDELSVASFNSRFHQDQNKQRNSKPPPISIKQATRGDVMKFFDSIRADKSKYTIKFVPDGVKIHPEDTNSHNLLRNELQKAKAKFFTHELRENQLTKIVLHGMYDMETSDLKLLLNELEIYPSDIKKMTIKNKRFDDHSLYLLYFSKLDKIKVANLRETNVINCIKVRWEYFDNKRRGPIQCNRCMQFGHGGKLCFLDPVCIRCGGSHASKECPHLYDPITKQLRERISAEHVKCGLCGQNHTANYAKCLKRKEFEQRQNNYRSKTQRVNHQRQFQPAPQLNDFNFPQMAQSSKPAWSNQAPQVQPPQPSQDLFEPGELLNILRELMSSLRTATTREQQINALGQIVIKYCYN
jgi:hypothetical protein